MTSFDSLGLSSGLVESVKKLGFESPTPIQEKAIPELLTGNKDFVGLASTGTGKTAAFGLPLLELIEHETNHIQALVLAPTRELCMQITSDLEKFMKGFKSLNIVAVYGGASISDQIKKIKKGSHIIVATPGRLIDLIDRKVIKLDKISYVVLDEADEMLNMGFKEDIDTILTDTPDEKRTWLFSATMPKEVRRIANDYMTDPVELTIGEKNAGNVNIDHQYIQIQERDKYLVLKRLLDYHPDMFGLVFCRTKVDTQKVAEKLVKDGYNADALHGDLSQLQRDTVMGKFRSRTIRMLVATDVAARGIDVSGITHVFHMNLPDELEFYTHRSGRTGRAGLKGASIALLTRSEARRVPHVEQLIKSKFRRIELPSGEEICQKQVLSLVHRLRQVKVNDKEMDSFLPEVFHELKDLSKEDIIKKFASLEFNRFLDYYRDAPQLNVGEERDGGNRDRMPGGERFFINLGKMDGIDKGMLLKMISEFCDMSGKSIGKIDLKGAYSFFEVEPQYVSQVLEGLSDIKYKGRAVRVEQTGGSSSGNNRPKKFSGKKDKKRARY